MPVGDGLYVFLRARLPASLTPKGLRFQPLPGRPARGLSWDVDNSYLVATRPTRKTLEKWSRARALRIGCGGRILVHFEPPRQPRRPIDLDAMIREIKADR